MTAPINSPSRSPRVLVVDNTAETCTIRDALQQSSITLRCADTLATALQALRRFNLDVVLADPLTASALWGAVPQTRKRPLPPFLIAQAQTTDARDIACPSKHRLAQTRFDVRQIVADIHALMLGREGADTTPRAIDGRLSLIPDCGLVFSGAALVPLFRAERAMLIMMAASPGRIFTWDELKAATGCTQAAIYGKADRLRQTLSRFSPEHEYIATIRGRGISLELDENYSTTNPK